jgi:hypothetical protein
MTSSNRTSLHKSTTSSRSLLLQAYNCQAESSLWFNACDH